MLTHNATDCHQLGKTIGKLVLTSELSSQYPSLNLNAQT
jgi:hypothetical protein